MRSQPDKTTDPPRTTERFEVFFDGKCPLCRREIDMIRRKDKLQHLILTDIASPDFSIEDRTQEILMREIHGRFPDGTYVTGVEVFRQIYDRLGFGGLVIPTRLPVIKQLLDLGYRCFAYFRFKRAMHRMRKFDCSSLGGTEKSCRTLAGTRRGDLN